MPADQVMPKFKRGKLHSGSKKGPKIKNRKQAIAVMLSEKRAEEKHGGKYPEKKAGGAKATGSKGGAAKAREKRLEGMEM